MRGCKKSNNFKNTARPSPDHRRVLVFHAKRSTIAWAWAVIGSDVFVFFDVPEVDEYRAYLADLAKTVNLQRRAAGNLTPVAPVHTQYAILNSFVGINSHDIGHGILACKC